MVRSSSGLVAVLLFAFAVLASQASIVKQQELQHLQLSPPTTHLLLHNNLYTAIRTNVQNAHSSAFSGSIVGKYTKKGGSGEGSYSGDFRGTTDGKNTRAIFKYNVNGNCKVMGFSMTYNGGMNGKMQLHGTSLYVTANYGFKSQGATQGKPVTASVNGNVHFTVRNRNFYYRERGVASMMIGNKSVHATYTAKADNHVVSVWMYGMYDGKKFFVNYSFSMNMLPLAVQMNPVMVERNYGTITVTAGGKTYTQKFDMKGMHLPKLE